MKAQIFFITAEGPGEMASKVSQDSLFSNPLRETLR